MPPFASELNRSIIVVPPSEPRWSRSGPRSFLELVLVLYTGIWFSSPTIQDSGWPPVERSSSFLPGFLKQPEIATFLTAHCLLLI